MGCQPSDEQGSDIVSINSDQDLHVGYRQFLSQNRGEVFEFYELGQVISQSNTSIIRRAKRRNTGIKRVCKILAVSSHKSLPMLVQVEVLKTLTHPNIVQAHEFYIEKLFVYIILEQIQGETLLASIQKRKSIKFTQIVSIMKQILLALTYCHHKKIAHRSINSENILVSWVDDEPFVKMIDFSQTIPLDCPKLIPVHRDKLNFSKDFDHGEVLVDKTDVRDCAYLFFCILTGEKRPKNSVFCQCREDILLTLKMAISNFTKTKDIVKQSLYQLIENMLELDPKKRYSSKQALNHPFFANTDIYLEKAHNNHSISSEILGNMINFEQSSKLKTLLYMYTSLNLTSTMQKASYMTEFYNLDKNQDGEIQFEEMVEGLIEQFKLTESVAQVKAKGIFQKLDKDENGSLDFNEFILGSMGISSKISQEVLKTLFKELDLNGDGRVTEQQLNDLIGGIEDYRLFEGKKYIKFQQFCSIMKKFARNVQTP